MDKGMSRWEAEKRLAEIRENLKPGGYSSISWRQAVEDIEWLEQSLAAKGGAHDTD
jgi:hypothetical protein